MKKVLAVEDDVSTMNLLVHFLEKLSYKVSLADYGKKVPGMVNAQTFDLILLDLGLPDINGFEVLKEIKKSSYNENTPVIIVTANSQQNSVLKAIKMGAIDFVTKPFDAGTLLHKVSRHINRKIEAGWRFQSLELEKNLLAALSALDHGHQSIISEQPFPFGKFQEAAELILDLTMKNRGKDILEAVREHDAYMFVHAIRMAVLLQLFLSSKNDIPLKESRDIIAGGLLHDIGWIKIPFKVLNKVGEFNPEEWEEMKSHVNCGLEAIKKAGKVPDIILDIAANHHERLDGSGYPGGLKANEISSIAKNAAVVDAYVSLTDRRAYRKGYSHNKSIEILLDSGRQFDEGIILELDKFILKGNYA